MLSLLSHGCKFGPRRRLLTAATRLRLVNISSSQSQQLSSSSFFLLPPPHHLQPTVSSSSSSSSSSLLMTHHRNKELPYRQKNALSSEEWWRFGVGLGLAIISAAASSSSCTSSSSSSSASCQGAATETSASASSNSSSNKVKEEVKVEDDPYETLPEEDEETDCVMCNTFRQGPCRPYWRKLENCFKDHEQEENGNGAVLAQCMRYFTPHQECLSKYTNLYHLISLELKQQLVRDIELSVTKQEQRTWKPTVDWAMWQQFVKEAGLDFCQTLPSAHKASTTTPLWKRLPPNLEPVLLTLSSPLPKTIDESGLVLKIAYAVDQDGMVLGLSYNEEYGELIKEATASASASASTETNQKKVSVDSNKSNGTTKDDSATTTEATATTFQLDFHVLPGETKKVRICALYAENPLTADPKKEIVDALLFKSQAYSLRKIARQ